MPKKSSPKEPKVETASSEMSSEKSNWTIMIYLAGDNDLSEVMANSLELINGILEAKPFKNNKVSLLAYYDSNVLTIPPLYCDINENERINILHSKTINDFLAAKLENPDKTSSESSDSIINFVKWCVNEKGNKADNYALFLSGHSNAFDEETLLRSDRSKEVLTIPELKATLEEVYEIINADKEEGTQKPLDILGFDSCVMSLLEIGYEFRGLAKYMIASQGETPNAGWDYVTILNNLIQDEDKTDARELAQNIVKKYIDSQLKFQLGGRSSDISALDLDKTEEVAEAIEKLFGIFKELLQKPYQEDESGTKNEEEFDFDFIVQQQIQKTILMAHWNCQTYWFEQAIDIYDFCVQIFRDLDFLKNQCTLLSADSPKLKPLLEPIETIRDACGEVIWRVRQCVIANGCCGADFQFSNGLSLFFPWSVKAFRLMQTPYMALTFTQTKGRFWVDFLDYYLQNPFIFRRRKKPVRQNPFPEFYTTVNEKGQIELKGTKEDSERGTKEDSKRGTKEDSKRGTKEDPKRGTKEDSKRGTKEDSKRGTKEDSKRGTKEDSKRGTSAFLNSFKTLKNYDSDYWYFYNTNIKEDAPPKPDLKFSDGFKEFRNK